MHRYKSIISANQSFPQKQSRLYKTWRSMLYRCYNHRSPLWQNYGAKGIQVCERWHNYENFANDMGEPPSKNHSIDRFPDPEGDYSPVNTRWATPQQQSRNKINSVKIKINGNLMLLTEWAEQEKIEPYIVHRIRQGWDIERAISTPKSKHFRD